MTSAEATWEQLAEPWRLAFTEAWASWCEGNLGIGAVLVDGTSVVSTGRNRVNQHSDDANTLSGNFMAHAEMNAFAAMPSYKATDLTLYTTLEPCLMCAATAVFLHVDHVHFASSDEFFEDLDELWQHHPYSARHAPGQSGPILGKLAALGRVLPLSVEAAAFPKARPLFVARQVIPEVAALAEELAHDQTLAKLRGENASADDLLASLWARLPDSHADTLTK